MCLWPCTGLHFSRLSHCGRWGTLRGSYRRCLDSHLSALGSGSTGLGSGQLDLLVLGKSSGEGLRLSGFGFGRSSGFGLLLGRFGLGKSNNIGFGLRILMEPPGAEAKVLIEGWLIGQALIAGG